MPCALPDGVTVTIWLFGEDGLGREGEHAVDEDICSVVEVFVSAGAVDANPDGAPKGVVVDAVGVGDDGAVLGDERRDDGDVVVVGVLVAHDADGLGHLQESAIVGRGQDGVGH